jgi:hypothetical protein
MAETAALMVLMTVHGLNGQPSLAQAAGELGVSVADIDRHFGVVPINPAEGLYAVQVKESSIRNDEAARGDYRGPFSNPEIAPLGPIQPRKKP